MFLGGAAERRPPPTPKTYMFLIILAGLAHKASCFGNVGHVDHAGYVVHAHHAFFQACVFAFSTTDRASLLAIRKWRKKVKINKVKVKPF